MSRGEDEPAAFDVAVVGAGPVGLLLAGELAAGGISVVVLERDAVPSSLPKANGIVGRTAVELAKRGVLRGTRIRVVSPPWFQFGPLVLRLGLGPGNPLHILPIPQRRLEELLERRATERGVEVRRGHEVTGFMERSDGMVVSVRTGDATERIPARYLVGCDGARSLVRKAAGIGFPGFTSEEISRIARVTIPADRITRRRDRFHIEGVGEVVGMRPNLLPGGAFTIAPAAMLDRRAPDDLYLISTQEPRGDAEAEEAVPVEDLRASLRRVLGADLPFTDASWVRSTIANSRQADAYRQGRVLLAGDAAHLFNAGGSSLKVGLQDAFELADRLSAVLGGGASDCELDGYEAVRRPAGKRTLAQTRAQAALARNDEEGAALREVVGELIRSRGAARRLARLIEE